MLLSNISLIFSLSVNIFSFNLAKINKLFNTLSLKLSNLSLLFNNLSIKLSLSLSLSLLSSLLLTFLLSSLSFSLLLSFLRPFLLTSLSFYLLSFLQFFLLTSHIRLLPINFNTSSLRFLNSFFSIALSNNSLIPFTNSHLSATVSL